MPLTVSFMFLALHLSVKPFRSTGENVLATLDILALALLYVSSCLPSLSECLLLSEPSLYPCLTRLASYWWLSASSDAAIAPSPASAPSALDINIVCWLAFLCAAAFLGGSIWFLLSELRGPVSRMLERCYGVAGLAVAATVEGEAEMDPLLASVAGRKNQRR